ncbi:MAG: aminoacyl-tRNA hydrolase [Acholeplasmataceae bacterium]
MKLIIGLGNPGKNYEHTRHNVGYDSVSLFAKENQITFKYEPRFEGMIGTYIKDGYKAILLKPTTFMNLSGRSVLKVCEYFKIDTSDLLIISDDINLTLGAIRLRYKGSSGGHNGLRNIIDILKTEEIKRLRIGISNDVDVVDYVLSKFSKKDRKVIDQTLIETLHILYDFIHEKAFEEIMTKYNQTSL